MASYYMADQYSLDALKELLEKSRQYKPTERELTFFDTAARKHYENPTTELLAFFLNPNNQHGLGDLFFESFIQSLKLKHNIDLNNYNSPLKIETEISTHDLKRIDLLIETEDHLFIIECKIHHHQNNPIDSYLEYAKDRAKNSKTIVPVVLCLDGLSDFNQWTGISYQDLTKNFKFNLAKKSFENPYNKWFLFAREFILHLENYYEDSMNLENFSFIKNNSNEIAHLLQLHNQVFQDLQNHIFQKLEDNLQSQFKRRSDPGKYNNNPEYWFGNYKIDDWICPTLEVEQDKSGLPCKVHFCIQHPKNHQNLISTFKKSELFNNSEESTWFFAKNIEYKRFTWKYASLDIDIVTEQILELSHFTINQLCKSNSIQ
ncbi:hypothetical protein E0H81_02875 [Acinetobacter terrestris]|nr:hypothetical protein E0H81_02875 [Acinetobacter terrestris]